MTNGTEQAIEDRVLGIFQTHGELMAEEVFPIYENLHGSTARSNSIHTTISRLTKKGFLYVVRRQTSPQTNKLVNVWKEHTGTFPQGFVPVAAKPTNSQIQGELDILKLRYKNLEESNTKLYQLIEQLREENDKLKHDLQHEIEVQAGADL